MPPRGALAALAVLLGLAVGMTGAGATTRHGDATFAPGTVTTLPVTGCPTSYGAGNGSGPFVPRRLPSTTSVRGLGFYSNGLLTVLAPTGWACGALVAADGGQRLDVFPRGSANDSVQTAPKGAEVVEVDADYTGHLPGAEDVCALFPHSAAASAVKVAGLPCPGHPGEKVTALTDDVVTFSDRPGVAGSGTASGGALGSSGAAVYPQVPSASASVNVALLSCTLPKADAARCAAILGDFLVRNAPSYVPTQTP